MDPERESGGEDHLLSNYIYIHIVLCLYHACYSPPDHFHILLDSDIFQLASLDVSKANNFWES